MSNNPLCFETRAYIKGCVGLNVSDSQIYNDILKVDKVVQLLHAPYFPDLVILTLLYIPVITTLYSLLPVRQILVPATISCFLYLRNHYGYRSALGSAI